MTDPPFQSEQDRLFQGFKRDFEYLSCRFMGAQGEQLTWAAQVQLTLAYEVYILVEVLRSFRDQHYDRLEDVISTLQRCSNDHLE